MTKYKSALVRLVLTLTLVFALAVSATAQVDLSQFDPDVVFQSAVRQVTRMADSRNAATLKVYLDHYRDLKLNWERQRVKFTHRDPGPRVDVAIVEKDYYVGIAITTQPVTAKLLDPWADDSPPPPLKPNFADFGSAVTGPWFSGAHYVGARNTVPVGHEITRDGIMYEYVEMSRGFGGVLKLWMPVGK